jgi:hypothetical protein
MRSVSGFLVLVLFVSCGNVRAADYVWWEGEDCVETNFVPDNWLSENQGNVCSGGKWLTLNQKGKAATYTALYRIEVPKGGEYELWSRQGYRGWCGNFWRFDAGDWQEAKSTDPAFNYVTLAQHRPAVWTCYGTVKLEKGAHTFEIKLEASEKKGALMAFDCFILSKGRFTPCGRYKPDEAVPIDYAPPVGKSLTSVPVPDPKDWWAFRPPPETFAPTAIDLSSMNDPVGKHGFLKMTDGKLVFEDGTQVRFWGTNCGFWQGTMIYPSHRDADFLARRLAKLGVNCVRLHIMHATNSLIDNSRDDTQHFDADRLDKLDYLMAALKKQGIYSLLSFQYNRKVKAGDNVPEDYLTKECGGATYNSCFFVPRIKELNAKMFKDFLTRENPYTKMRWIDDPAVSILEVHNEDSIFFWSLEKAPKSALALLEQMWNEWLVKRYKSTEEMKTAWQVEGCPSPIDDTESIEKKSVKRLHVWFTSTDGISPDSKNQGKQPRFQKRASDLMRFLYELEKGFYEEALRDLRAWGVKVPIVTSNWAGTDLTTRLELWCSSLGEVVDRHDYFGGNKPMLAEVGNGIIGEGFSQIEGRAFSISEWNETEPNDYAPEAAPLVAAMAALHGWDALYQFCLGSADWPSTLADACVTSPSCFLQYPLAALIFRRGDVREGDVIYERKLSPAQLFSYKPLDRKLSENQQAFNLGATEVEPAVLGAGKAVIRYVPEDQPSTIGDLTKLWDKANKVVRSNTGELTWDYGRIFLKVDAPRTQGAVGALAGVKIECKDVSIETPNPFCSIFVSSLKGDAPIAKSDSLVVFAVGRSLNNGAQHDAERKKFAKPGGPPIFMEPVRGTVRIATPGQLKAFALDAHGNRLEEIATTVEDGKLTIKLEGKPQVVYYELGVK